MLVNTHSPFYPYLADIFAILPYCHVGQGVNYIVLHAGGCDDKRTSHSKGHHQRKANLFPECGIADAYQMQKKSFQDSFDLLLSQIYYLVLGSGFNQEMECKVVLAKLTNRRDKKVAQGLALVN